MRLGSTRTIAAAVTGLALLAGAATALAASGSGSPGSDSAGSTPPARGAIAFAAAVGGDCKGLPPRAPFADPLQAAADYLGLSFEQLAQELSGGKSLADVAAAHGKSVDGLKQAVLDAAKSKLDASAAAGKITADEADRVFAQLKAQLDDLVAGKGGLAIKIERGGGAPHLDGPFSTAATYLGLSEEELMKQLQAGKSLAEVAAAQGKSADTLEQAIFDAEKARLQKAIHELVNEKGLPGPPCAAKLGTGAVVPAPAVDSSGNP